MNCPSCHTQNDDENVYCVNCGTTISSNAGINAPPPPTVLYPNLPDNQFTNAPSVETAFIPKPDFNPVIPNFVEPVPPKSNKTFLFVGFGLILILLVGGIAGAVYFFNKQIETAEMLPDHLGLFIQTSDKKSISEIARQEFTNVLKAKEELSKNESLTVIEPKPNLLLYSDGKDIPINDLKLVQLDSINEDGSLSYIKYQVSYVEGKPEMKRLLVPEGLADGKYVLALFDGFLDEGKHRLWAFQIKNPEKTDNGDLAKALTISTKPKTSPTPTPIQTPTTTETITNANPKLPTKPDQPIAPPEKSKPRFSAGDYAFCRTDNVVLRNAPSLTAGKVDGLYQGQKLYIVRESDNYTTWRGQTANWVYVETDEGQRGWVFSPLLRY